MIKILISALLPSLIAAAACRGAAPADGGRCDFDSARMIEEKCHFHWVFRVPHTRFFIVDEPTATDRRALAVVAKSSSGIMIFKVEGMDLKKTPYMRWRWRIVRRMNLPEGAAEPDDQACAVYLSDGTMLNQKCVGYRWEHFVPVGTRRMINYACSKVDVLCLRNRETPVGEWVEEECNVFEDFKRAFGKEPSKDAVLAIGANSQYSKSDTRVEIDYIEFRSSPATGK